MRVTRASRSGSSARIRSNTWATDGGTGRGTTSIVARSRCRLTLASAFERPARSDRRWTSISARRQAPCGRACARLIAEHIAEDYLGAFTNDPADLDVAQRFCKLLADEGLLTIAWPTEYGGGGGSVWDQTVVREEMWAHHEPRGAQYMGLNWVGPAIMAFGSDAQKQQHLSAIAAGDVIWCQGFSEPEAGSDLASLKTRAVDDGDGWRITGQKIWTSYAGMAQWCVLAARVGPGERHEGITMFVVPMDTPGITVRPIRSMLGHHHLNEVFFDDVWAGPEAVLGGIGEGWAVIRKALAHERVGIARYARCERLLQRAGPGARLRTGTTCRRRCGPSGPGPSCRCAWPGCSPTGRCTRRPAGELARRATPRRLASR